MVGKRTSSRRSEDSTTVVAADTDVHTTDVSTTSHEEPPAKKQKTWVKPIKLSRTKVIKKVTATEVVIGNVFYHDGGWWVDLINVNKPGCGLPLSTDVLVTLNYMKEYVGEQESKHNLGENVYLTRSLFRSKWYVSVREYYTSDDGTLQPGRQGVTVDLEGWRGVKASISYLGKYLMK
jgi:hypothetical protein